MQLVVNQTKNSKEQALHNAVQDVYEELSVAVQTLGQ